MKEHAWKVCIREIVSWVRIPPSPPDSKYAKPRLSGLCRFYRSQYHQKCRVHFRLAQPYDPWPPGNAPQRGHYPIGQSPPAPPAAEPAGLLPGPLVPLPPDVPISPAAAPFSRLTFPLASRSRMGSTGVPVVVDLPGSTVGLPGPVVVIGLSLSPGRVTPGLGAPPLGACPG